jgi:hypothetical protein
MRVIQGEKRKTIREKYADRAKWVGADKAIQEMAIELGQLKSNLLNWDSQIGFYIPEPSITYLPPIRI